MKRPKPEYRGAKQRALQPPKSTAQAGDNRVYLPGRQPLLELEAKRPSAILRVMLQETIRPTPELDAALDRLARRGVPLNSLSSEELDSRCPQANHQGIVAEIQPLAPCSLEAIIKRSLERNRLVLALDGINDPQNLGALLRVADACGVDGVVIPSDRASGLTPAVRRISAGASEFVPLCVVTNLRRALEKLRDAGYWRVGSTLSETSQDAFAFSFPEATVLVIGSEAHGMRALTEKECDFLVHLPMLGAVQSLNASNAASALLYEILRQRRGPSEAGSAE